MEKLKEVLTVLLDTTRYAVYYNQKPSKVDYPFVIFRIPYSTQNEIREDFTLYVDVWTKSINTDVQMTDTIDKLLNKYKHIDEDMQISIYRTNRLNQINDEDDAISRSRLIYTVKTYFLGGN